MTLASTQVGQTPDILQLVCSYLPPSTLFSCLLTSSTFFHSSAPELYRSLHIKHARDCFVGATRQSNGFYTSSSASPTSSSSSSSTTRPRPISPYSKDAVLSFVRKVHIHTHGRNECPFVLHYINPLPHLEYVHLAGGVWPAELAMGDICDPETCQFLAKVCTHAKKAMIRQANLGPLKLLTRLEHVTVKIRPCQLPLYIFHDTAYQWSYPVSLSSAKIVDLVFWDERHSFRIEWRNIPGGGLRSSLMGLRYHRPPSSYLGGESVMLKGCTYCDERGCVRHTPHAALQLPALMATLGMLVNVKMVRVWNVDHTARRQWKQGMITVEAVKRRMEEAWLTARSENVGCAGHNEEELDDQGQAGVSFHSASEYFTSAQFDMETDQEESKYWQNLVEPNQRILHLRRQVQDMFGGDDESFDRYSERELEGLVENARWRR
ncbi:hypothetical protein AYX14_05852 [Cryptococcus neoformans]|nr:hypothetical protein AYX14_05852 [Cryptococcus neoformans var. grubii]